MAYLINLGGWGSVFAVPASIVDNGLKLASETQLKVVLYILRHGGERITDETVSEALSIHTEDVRDAIEYWVGKGLFISTGNELCVADNNQSNDTPNVTEQIVSVSDEKAHKTEKKEKPRPVSRSQKPEPAYVRARIKGDSKLKFLMDETASLLGKLLSQPDMATILMLHDTDGLPVDVILMLVGHCKEIGMGNMKYIEKTGIRWANDGVFTVNLAEEKIKSYSEFTSAWNTVATVFGIHLTGSPTEKQLEFAGRWVNEWMLSESMLRLAYERCVDIKGEVKLSYINGILKRWNENSLKTVDDVIKFDAQSSSKKHKSKTSGDLASYDIDAYESKSIFDD
ncbi:MAG: DnaD domain protein [Ruminococcaceae bacterium]|nr:DnaD domain protein [Oscillospiraceae bacterium]